MRRLPKDFECELEIEFKDVLFNVLCTVIMVHDPDYGADADGNRGIAVWFLDDIDYDIPASITDNADRAAFAQLVNDLCDAEAANRGY